MTSTKILEIITPALDPNVSISLEQVEKLLEEAEFDLQDTGCESVRQLLEQFEEEFELIDTESCVMVKCISPASPKETAKMQLATTQPALSKETAALNRKIGGVIRKLLKDCPDSNGNVSLSTLGTAMSAQNLKLPDGEKLGAYLRQFPSLFEVFANGIDTCVRNVVEQSTLPAMKTVNNTQVVHKGFVSMFNIFDFAYFQDYGSVKKELSQLASQEGWFPLPDPQEKDPYLLLDYKFRNNFAILVNKQLKEGGNAIIMQPDRVELYTGFTTDKGNVIKALFKFNQQRDSTRWQNWVFDSFSIE